MLAPSAQISTNRLNYWLDGAGTSATARTLKVKDAAAYNALKRKDYLPDNWQKGKCTVLDISGNAIE